MTTQKLQRQTHSTGKNIWSEFINVYVYYIEAADIFTSGLVVFLTAINISDKLLETSPRT